MPLIRIVYYSERDDASSLDMRRLLDTCERNNGRDDIGGFLHYNGFYFLQVLEGGRAVVRACYDRIRSDRTHKNLVLIGAEAVIERKFTTWNMALNAGMTHPTKEEFLKMFSASAVDPGVLAG